MTSLTLLKHPAIGTLTPSGEILAVRSVTGATGGKRLQGKVKCLGCGGQAWIKLSDLLHGPERRCKCGRSEAYLHHLECRAAGFAASRPAVAEAVWESAEVDGLDTAASRHQIDRPLTSALYRQVRGTRLSRLAPKMKAAIYSAAQRVGFARAAGKYQVPVALVMLVSRAARKIEKARKESIKISDHLTLLALSSARAALDAVEGRWTGSLTAKELPSPSRPTNRFSWAASFLRGKSLPATVRPVADAFLGLVDRTMQGRRERRGQWNADQSAMAMMLVAA